jgi:hypothetical protein
MPSVDPTPTQVLASAKALGGRISLMRQETLRLLSSVLPEVVELANQEQGISIRPPKSYYVARQVIEKNAFPAIIVGTSVGSRPSPPRTRFRDVTLQLYIVDAAAPGREQLDDLWDLAELADMVMLHTQSGWCAQGGPYDGRKVWTELVFEGMSQLPDGWEDYAGVVVTYSALLAGINGWTPNP